MKSVEANRVINGTFGSMTVDTHEMAQVIALQAKVSLEKQQVAQTGTLSKGYKVTGIDGKGTVKLNKVSSYFLDLLSENLLAGKTTSCTIVSTLADPDALGAEQIQLNDCQFDEMTLADWEAQKLGEESIPFTFGSWKILQSIKDV